MDLANVTNVFNIAFYGLFAIIAICVTAYNIVRVQQEPRRLEAQARLAEAEGRLGMKVHRGEG